MKYTIKKSQGIGQKYDEIAKVWLGDDGQLHYEMIIPDQDIEEVILKAQKDGGLFIRVPYSDNVGKLQVKAQKRQFIRINDEQIFNAIEINLKSGLVEPENF